MLVVYVIIDLALNNKMTGGVIRKGMEGSSHDIV